MRPTAWRAGGAEVMCWVPAWMSRKKRWIVPERRPAVPEATFADTYEFAELLSRRLEAAHPGEVTTEWLKKKRSGVLVDHRQNGWGKTIASVYSVRPKPGAPVSTPLHWDELTEEIRPRDFSMAVALERVAANGDLFEGVLHAAQALGPALKALR